MVHHGLLRSMILLALLISGLLLSCGRNQASEPRSGQSVSAIATVDTTATAGVVATQVHTTQLAMLRETDIAADFPFTQEAYDLQTVEAGGVLPTSAATINPELAVWMTQEAETVNFSSTPLPLFSEGRCDSMEDAPDIYVAGEKSCWVVNDWQRQESYTVYTGVLWEDPMQGGITFSRYGGELTYVEMRPIDVLAPQKQGMLLIESATWPLVYITTQTTPTQHLIFNLETRQWLDPNGTPIPVTATPTSN